MTLQLGLILALVCAVATNLGFLFKQRGAVAAPPVDMRRPLRTVANLFRSKWWTVGILVAVFAWLFHVAALALAPLSLVQAVLSGGLVLLAVLAERCFGFTLGRREWLGVALAGGGLAFLAVTSSPHGAHSSYQLSAMVPFQAGLVALGALLILSPRSDRVGVRHHGILLAAAAGILFGVSDVAIKALTGTVSELGLLQLLSPWTLTAIVASIVAFFASARSLQIGDAVPVIALTSVAANVSAILGGILVFGDPLPGTALGVIAHLGAFVLVLAAAVLMPGPIRAARAAA